MLRFSEINWAEITASTESPVKLCLRKDVAVYFKVRGDTHLVYRHHNVFGFLGSPRKSHLVTGFDEELVFLRLGNSSLAEISVSRSTFVSSFSGGGFTIPRPYHMSERTNHRGWKIREYEAITDPTLEKVEFLHAFLVNKKKWELSYSDRFESFENSLERCKDSLEITESDLYFASSDIQALRTEVQQGRELVKYPFAHKERMPGIYLMFQAAYAHNERKIMPKDKVEEWLREKEPKNTYRYKSVRTAKKFVWSEVDRSQGGGERGDFQMEELAEFGDTGVYEFSFVSKGLSFILAIADWWVTITNEYPDETRLTLAKKLDAWRFGGLEVGDLVYLISGAQIKDDEVTSFYEYQEGLAKKVRPIVDRKLK
jgi:hypothetical protein